MKSFKQLFQGGLASPEKLFLVLASIFGLCFALATPPMQAPDEHHHYFRSYQVSTGKLVPEQILSGDVGLGGNVPESVKKTGYEFLGTLPGNPTQKTSFTKVTDALGSPLTPQQLSMTHFEPASTSSFVPYLPQAFGQLTGRLLGGSPLVLFYLGRLCNLAVWIGLGYLAIKMIPFAKWLYVVLLLNPVMVFLASSLSADALTNGLAFLWVALILRYRFLKRVVTRSELITLALIALGLAMCKQAYFVLVLLVWLLPAKNFISSRLRYVLLGSITLVALIGSGWWMSISRSFLPLLIQNFQIPEGQANPNGQLHYILSHPIRFAWTIIKTFTSNFTNYAVAELNGRLGWADVILPNWLIALSYGTVTISALGVEAKAFVLSKFVKWYVLACATLTVVVLSAILYMSWSPYEGFYVFGFQGRYFFPLLPLIAALLAGKRAQLTNFRYERFLTVAVVVLLSTSLAFLIGRYYV